MLKQVCGIGTTQQKQNSRRYYHNENRGAYSRGDVNGNGTIDPNDYLIAKRAYLGTYTPTAAEIDIMDINRNGVVDSNDYLYIQRYYFRTYYFPPV